LKHSPNQGGGGGFTRGPSDADCFAGDRFHEYLRVVCQRKATPMGFDQQGYFERDTTRNTHQIYSIQGFEGMSTQDPIDLQASYTLLGSVQLIGRALIIKNDIRSLRDQVARHG
jgi:hypothetical protein